MSTPWYDLPISNGYSTTAIPGNWDSPHYAVDIPTPYATPITDLLAGTVVKSDYAPWGGEVFVKLANGLQEYFYHLSSLNVSVGQSVQPGQLIGLSGGQNSGGNHPVSSLYSSGPHVHFGITNGQVVNSGPAGQQYYGIDPTSIISAAKAGTLAGVGNGGTSINTTTGYSITDPTGISQAINSLNSTLEGVNQIGTFAQNTNTFLNNTDWKDVGIRGGLILIGVIILLLGIYLFVS
jgi:murein DD-endopeptidase MepM/ murein hydrolase activator NlpD